MGKCSAFSAVKIRQLGSASLSTNASGGKLTDIRYYPYGETRSGTLATDRRYTGQRQEIGLGLYDYTARYYDPYLNRFLSPDTIIPDPANPQSLNRYSYCLNNPLRFSDPSGRFTKDQVEQHLREQGYSDDAIASIIYMWIHNSEHKDWWALLMEAEPGDVLNAVDTRIGTGFDRLWNGMFLNNDEGKLLFRYINSDAHYSVATFYSDNPLDSEANIRQDIILGRQGTKLGLATDSYVFHAGTDIFAGGTFSSQPDQGKWGSGLVDVGSGAVLMAHATGKVLIGAFTAPSGVGLVPLAVGLGEFCLGAAAVSKGVKEWIGYFDEVNTRLLHLNREHSIS